MVTILPRSAWTRTKNGRAGRTLSKSAVTSITLHYPGSGNVTYAGRSKAQIAALLEGWRKLHTSAPRRWADIGYNYAVDQAGRIWYLTGYNRGAHAGGSGIGNSTSIGVLLIVGNKEEPTEEMIASVRALRDTIRRTFPKATAVVPHSRWTSTACPGDKIQALIEQDAFTSSAPAPAPKPKQSGPVAKGTILTLNVASRKFSFAKRAPRIAKWIIEQDRDIVLLQECYAALRPLIHRRIKDNYALAGVQGGRVIYVRRGRWAKVGDAKGYRLGRNKKQAVAVKIKHRDTGAVVNVVNAHLSYKRNERAQRREETRELARAVNRDFPTGYDLYGGDWNWPRNYYLGDDIADEWEKFGIIDAGTQVGPSSIGNRVWNTYNGNRARGPRQNLHIDRFASKGLLRFTKVVNRAPKPFLSDHYAVLAWFTVPVN